MHCSSDSPLSKSFSQSTAGRYLTFETSTAAEAVWLFDVALTFWAIVKFGRQFGSPSTTQNRTIVTCERDPLQWFLLWHTPNENPSPGSEFDDVDGWIRRGGPVSFQGLGELTELTVSKILAIFSERLENMSWSIAQRFRHVLTNLGKE